MLEVWTRQRVIDLAPDAQSAAAGEQQAASAKWEMTERSERALWGAVRGSGKNPYLVAIDLLEPAFKCSCPSRKFPCKHGLGLFLIYAEGPERFVEGTAPDWVQEWLAGRDQRQVKKEQRAAAPPKPTDLEAQAKRAAQRGEKVARGLEELQAFLLDVVRQGLIEARSRPLSDWTRMAQRMVDAQAPGLAREVAAMGAALTSGAGWEARCARILGRVQLAVRAHAQGEGLAPDQRADLRAFLGFTVSESDLAAEPEGGTYQVLGQVLREEDRLLAQSTWLRRKEDGRWALVLSFAAGGRPLDQSLVVGTEFAGSLLRFPGALGLRAEVQEPRGAMATADLARVRGGSIAEELRAYAAALGKNPWLSRWPISISEALVQESIETQWWAVQANGARLALDLDEEGALALLALSGGAPLTLMGEWDGSALRPLTAFQDGRGYALSRDEREPQVVAFT